jgi:hypothetical protein
MECAQVVVIRLVLLVRGQQLRNVQLVMLVGGWMEPLALLVHLHVQLAQVLVLVTHALLRDG